MPIDQAVEPINIKVEKDFQVKVKILAIDKPTSKDEILIVKKAYWSNLNIDQVNCMEIVLPINSKLVSVKEIDIVEDAQNVEAFTNHQIGVLLAY